MRNSTSITKIKRVHLILNNASRNDNRQRSVSLQNEVISLKQMDSELNNRSTKTTNKSISFCGMSFIIDSLLKASAGVNDKKTKEVQVAVSNSDLQTLRRICLNDPSVTLAACVEAIDQSNDVVLKSIIEFSSSSDDNFLTDYGSDLLILAVQNEASQDCSIVLLKKGVSPDVMKSIEDGSAMHAAAKAGNKSMLEIMQKQYGGNVNLGIEKEFRSVLHAAVKGNSPETVQYLLQNGAINTSKNKFSSTALHHAAEHNFVECARILIEDGALIDALKGENERETALHIAASNGYGKMCSLLIKYGADVNAKKTSGETPLHLACKALADSVIQLLIDKGAHVDAKDNNGRPPLHYVINSGNKGGSKTMLILLNNKADINQADNYGNSPLHLAAVNHKLSKINVLIENGADLCSLDNANKSAFYTAIKYAPNSLKAIEKRLDAGLVMENPENEHEPSVRMDFTAIVPRTENLSIRSEVGLFMEVLNLQQTDPSIAERLLMHPLTEGFLQLKWSQIKLLYYIGLVLTHLIYSITYSVYAVLVFKNLCVPVLNDSIVSKVSCDFDISAGFNEHTVRVVIAQIAWFFLILFTIVYFVKELTRCIHLKYRYLVTMESFLNALVILSVLLITFYVNPFQNENISVYRWQYHACGFGVFITWLLQMFLIGKVPRFGKYVEMFKTVTKTFSNFFVAYIFLFVSFAVTFYILFPSQAGFKEVFPAAMVKVLVMMLGELEYDELYYPQEKTFNLIMANSTFGSGSINEETQSQYFPFTAHIMVTFFILFISIIIMNLLFGLAVTDIQALYKMARLHQLIQQVELINYMENILFSPVFKFFPDCIQKVFRRMLQGLSGRVGYRRYVKIVKMHDHTDKSLSINLKKKIFDRCTILHNQEEKKKPSLEQEVAEIRNQLKTVEALLRDVLNQKNGITYSRASTIRDDLNSIFSEDLLDGARQRARPRDPDIGEPSKSNMSLSVSLSKICEEDNPSHGRDQISRSSERF